MPQPQHRRHKVVIHPGRMLGGRADVRRGITAWQEDGGVGDHMDHMGHIDRVRVAMGIDWMTGDELSQAIPPVYTEWIGARLLDAIGH